MLQVWMIPAGMEGREWHREEKCWRAAGGAGTGQESRRGVKEENPGRWAELSVSPQQQNTGRGKPQPPARITPWGWDGDGDGDGVAPASPLPLPLSPRVPCPSLRCHPGSRSLPPARFSELSVNSLPIYSSGLFLGQAGGARGAKPRDRAGAAGTVSQAPHVGQLPVSPPWPCTLGTELGLGPAGPGWATGGSRGLQGLGRALWGSVGLHGAVWGSVELHGTQQVSTGLCRALWDSMGLCRAQWGSLGLHGAL